MSRTKLLLDVVSDMRSLADSLETIANAVAGNDGISKEKQADKPSVTHEMLRELAVKLSRNGKREEIKQLIEKYGVKKENIMLDPGVGFGKTYEQNLMVMNHLEEIVDMGYPVLLGTSRKSVIGLTLDLPVDEREEGTLATSVLGAIKGCQFVRVHDVEKNVRALKMTDAILHS